MVLYWCWYKNKYEKAINDIDKVCLKEMKVEVAGYVASMGCK
jgi:hypothetical protein